MKVEFALRIPGNHRTVATATLSAVPREGEFVVLGERTHVVHSVTWDVAAKTAHVLLA